MASGEAVWRSRVRRNHGRTRGRFPPARRKRERPDSGDWVTQGIPPLCRNHRAPTAGEIPAALAASSVVQPLAIAAQKRWRSSRRATGGRPGQPSRRALANATLTEQIRAIHERSRWPERIRAVEGSGTLGRGVAQFLAGRGERVHEVNPRWTAQRRRGQRRPCKSDVLDAQAVACLLPSVALDVRQRIRRR
jgi:hypothetical protein